MSSKHAQVGASKESIVKHMNTEKTDSIRHCLQAFNGVPFYKLRNARMTNISLNNMELSYSGRKFTLPLNPPLESMNEARQRIVELDNNALQILGRSDVPITKFVPVNLRHPVSAFLFGLSIFCWVSFSSGANFQPGSLLYDNVFRHTPGFAQGCFNIQHGFIRLVIFSHGIEALIMAWKLNKHGLNPLDGLWWAWVVSVYFEGWLTFVRLHYYLKEKRQEMKQEKHTQ